MNIFSPSRSLASLYGSRLAGSLRIIGFFSLIFLLVPAQLMSRWVSPQHPFAISQLFYRSLLKILGFRIRVHGVISHAEPVMFVSNHTSYLDVIVLGALIPAAFVAKSDVAHWPMIGALAKLQNTLFIERRSSKISGQKSYLQNHLAQRRSLILFPEGTSTNGQTVLPFKSALFAVVEEPLQDIQITVQPVSVTCSGLDNMPMTRAWRSFYAWYGDMTLLPHLWDLFSLGHFIVDVEFHPPVLPSHFPNRKDLAQYCQQQVASGVERSLRGRSVTTDSTKQLASSPT